jgi:plasmid segregation protein ParM
LQFAVLSGTLGTYRKFAVNLLFLYSTLEERKKEKKEMVQTYAYGHDFGNAKTDGVMYCRGKKLSRSIPSATAAGKLSELVNLGIPLEEQDYVYRDSHGERYVGSLAMRQAKTAGTGRGDINRYWSRQSLQLLLTVAASLIPDQEFGLTVVTGLPVQTYMDDPDARKRVKAALEGTHAFTLNDAKRVVTVQIERVIMEGAGALIAYGMVGKQRQAVVDIGGRTTDLFAAYGQTPIRPYCNGKPLGVEDAADMLSKDFQGHYGRPLSLEERYNVLHAYVGGRPYPTLHTRQGEAKNIKEMVERSLHQVGTEIASFVSMSWNESESGLDTATSFARVLLVGGGAYYFSQEIERIIPHVQIAQSPHEANALGYAAFADERLKSALHIA